MGNPMWNLNTSQWKSIFRFFTLLLFIGVLLATLWPLQFRPSNDVAWLADGDGLQFGRHGILLSRGLISSDEASNDSSCSLEILLKAGSISGVSTFLHVTRSDHPSLFQLRQYHDGIIILHGPTTGEGKRHLLQRDVDHFFRLGRTMLLTLTSGPKGTSVYSDGRILERFPNYKLSFRELSGRLTFGTSPFQIDPWTGELHGLALYSQELNESRVLEHFGTWSTGHFERNDSDGNRKALFLFNEHSGNIVQNLVGPGTSLVIPPRFTLPLKPFLSPPWRDFERNWDYVNDVLRNIAGFIPLGFALCAYLFFGRLRNRAVLITIALCALTSLGIETLQWFIPQRESGMTDVLTNTGGAALGAFLFSWRRIEEIFSGLNEFD